MIPRYVINPSDYYQQADPCDCIVIGSGIAGLSTAIRLSQKHKVKVLTKSSLSESTTWYAQGGIAAAIKKPDFWKNHYRDTIVAGQGLCDPEAVKILVKNAPKMIEKLIELGIVFDISEGEISLTTEGGHSYPRILHAGGDATGEEIEKKLVKYSQSTKNIQFYPNYFALDLMTDNGQCTGVIGLNLENGQLEIHPAAFVVLASGGIGQIFNLTTNPDISTGDGIAMAYRAGAAIMDIEFVQFHPTVFRTKDKKLFLISEALRGEGAYLRDCQGKRFMLDKHPLAELAPRDIVVKEMVRVMNETNCNFVYLDATHLPATTLKVRFPNILYKLKENGLNLNKDLVKVSPAAHYMNGGVKTDYQGLTTLDRLYSCGEVAATGAHGANRLASNSLIEGLVYGWNIYREIDRRLKQETAPSQLGPWQMPPVQKEGAQPLDTDKIRRQLRQIMTQKAGILRDAKGLGQVSGFIAQYVNHEALYNQKDKSKIELANMLTVSYLLTKAAALREESRGTHQRNDFPHTDDVNWRKHILLQKDKIIFEEVKDA
ncbi:MAG: L-aspartate oxidase [Actinomycetota bacterium]|nr:L-aspartate oxidase [Actinomycetota bacterium]